MGLATQEIGRKHGNKPEDMRKMPSARAEVIRSKIALKNNVTRNLPKGSTWGLWVLHKLIGQRSRWDVFEVLLEADLFGVSFDSSWKVHAANMMNGFLPKNCTCWSCGCTWAKTILLVLCRWKHTHWAFIPPATCSNLREDGEADCRLSVGLVPVK
jgi:hypothetical protein